MKVQDKMALMGAGAVVDVARLVSAPAQEGAAGDSKRTAASAKGEPAVSLG